MSQYAHPEMLVETAWVAEQAMDASVRRLMIRVTSEAL
jgi:hypothetical protein